MFAQKDILTIKDKVLFVNLVLHTVLLALIILLIVLNAMAPIEILQMIASAMMDML